MISNVSGVLSKHDKEQIVIKLHEDGKTMRDIAAAAHMSFSDISNIIKKLDGRTNDIDMSSKSKASQVMFLFKSRKKPIDVSIDLDIPANEKTYYRSIGF